MIDKNVTLFSDVTRNGKVIKIMTAEERTKKYSYQRNETRAQKAISKVLLNSFPASGHTLWLCPWNQKLEDFVSPHI